MKFTDGKETVEIHVLDASGVEWTEDFYDDAPASDGNGVCHVPDARHPLEQAFDMLRGEGDYATAPGVGCAVGYDITDTAGYRIELTDNAVDVTDDFGLPASGPSGPRRLPKGLGRG